MSTAFSGTIALGMLAIPIKAHPLVSDPDISLRNLHAACGTPISHQQFCQSCQRSVEAAELTKAFKSGGDWIRIAQEELDAIELEGPEKDQRLIHIHQTIKPPEVHPYAYEKAYWLEPVGEAAVRPYAVLSRSLKDEQIFAVVTYVSHTKSHLGILHAGPNGLVLRRLHYATAVHSVEQLGIETTEVALSLGEIRLGRQLMRALYKPFEYDEYVDEAAVRLHDLAEAKVQEGHLPAPPAKPDRQPAKVISLLNALQLSLKSGKLVQAGKPKEAEKPVAKPVKKARKK